ncbi:ribosomal protein L15 [Tothia fuscella]|uniref:Ribosomal protein L15 n=1 Tax=Tothia fuscella TaxID=1048955 RepID=A0A9P4NPX2_9PEZI|nr:ribosomal protein L15 [Tothia fuscella]
MPPRLCLQRVCSTLTCANRNPQTIASLLLPLIAPQQQRTASILSSLSDVPSAYNKRIRRGRGPSSGKGKTSGRGHKGQKQHGKVPYKFNGGQTKDEVVSGTRGFENQFSVEMSPLNLGRIQNWIDQGRIDPSKPVTIKELCGSRCLHGIKDGVKLLAREKETLKTPINIHVSRASSAAIAAVEAAGGTVTTRYYTKPAIVRIRNGLTHPYTSLLSQSTDDAHKAFKYRLPDPASRKDIEYYRDAAHRGYLSYQVKDGHSPSLFFKTPGTGSLKKKVTAKKAAGENKVW